MSVGNLQEWENVIPLSSQVRVETIVKITFKSMALASVASFLAGISLTRWAMVAADLRSIIKEQFDLELKGVRSAKVKALSEMLAEGAKMNYRRMSTLRVAV
jgi:hypothetical protein